MDLEARALALKAEGIGYRAIAHQLRTEGHDITDWEMRKLLGISLGKEETPGAILPPPLESPKRRTVYTDARDAFFDWIGKETSIASTVPLRSTQGPYALFSDIHIPWHDKEALKEAVRDAKAHGCRILIIGGDCFDFYRLSRYAKKKLIRFEAELALCRVTLEWLASEFDEVWILGGNHDVGRWGRVLAEQISEEIRFLIRSPMDVLLADLPNVKMVGHKAPFGNELAWIFQLGQDCIITHCEASSAQQGKNLADLKNWVREWGQVLGLTQAPRMITSGHTHRGTVLHDYDGLLIETFTLASWDSQSYQFEQAAIKNRKPGVPGWTLIVQRDGVTDLRESRAIRLRA